jgi:hypothetical protein
MSDEAMPTGGKKKPGPKKGDREVKVEMDVILVGRDKKAIRKEEVFRLAAMGCKDTEISNWFGVDDNSLRYNFSAELKTGREALKQSLRQAQIQTALSGNATLLIWLGKQYLSQTENGASNDENKALPWNDED